MRVQLKKHTLITYQSRLKRRNQLFGEQKTVVSEGKQSFETRLLNLDVKTPTRETILKLYRQFGFDAAFARADIMKPVGATSSPAGVLISKLKASWLIEPVAGQGKGKYKFASLEE